MKLPRLGDKQLAFNSHTWEAGVPKSGATIGFW